MARKTHRWPSDDDLIALYAQTGSEQEVSHRLGVPNPSLRYRVNTRGLRGRAREALASRHTNLEATQAENPLKEQLRRLLRKPQTIEGLADNLDLAPKRVRDLLAELRDEGYRIPTDVPDTEIRLERVVPDKLNLHRSLLEGDELTVGVVSDTHLCSNEEAISELELAYDVFEREGITEVWHPGDLVAGCGIYRTQVGDLKIHTYERQVDYAVEHYPKRDGITTRLISGNHDIEGDYGKIGANPVAAVCNRRDDMEFLGDYSAWIELPNGAWCHLLHGKGAGSYALSYKAQKLVESYPAGRKPNIAVYGHWHSAMWIRPRGVHVIFPGCFEWRTSLMERTGLTPAVGFFILKITLGNDGSVVQFAPRWHEFWEGRVAA